MCGKWVDVVRRKEEGGVSFSMMWDTVLLTVNEGGHPHLSDLVDSLTWSRFSMQNLLWASLQRFLL